MGWAAFEGMPFLLTRNRERPCTELLKGRNNRHSILEILRRCERPATTAEIADKFASEADLGRESPVGVRPQEQVLRGAEWFSETRTGATVWHRRWPPSPLALAVSGSLILFFCRCRALWHLIHMPLICTRSARSSIPASDRTRAASKDVIRNRTDHMYKTGRRTTSMDRGIHTCPRTN